MEIIKKFLLAILCFFAINILIPVQAKLPDVHKNYSLMNNTEKAYVALATLETVVDLLVTSQQGVGTVGSQALRATLCDGVRVTRHLCALMSDGQHRSRDGFVIKDELARNVQKILLTLYDLGQFSIDGLTAATASDHKFGNARDVQAVKVYDYVLVLGAGVANILGAFSTHPTKDAKNQAWAENAYTLLRVCHEASMHCADSRYLLILSVIALVDIIASYQTWIGTSGKVPDFASKLRNELAKSDDQQVKQKITDYLDLHKKYDLFNLEHDVIKKDNAGPGLLAYAAQIRDLGLAQTCYAAGVQIADQAMSKNIMKRLKKMLLTKLFLMNGQRF